MTSGKPRPPKARIELWKLLVIAGGIVGVLLVIRPRGPDAPSPLPQGGIAEIADTTPSASAIAPAALTVPDDLIQYDRNKKREAEERQWGYDHAQGCAEDMIRMQLNAGTRSRKFIVDQALINCPIPLIISKVMTREQARAYIETYTSAHIDALATEGQ